MLTIDSGDTVTISTVSGTLGHLPKAGSGLTVPPALQAIHDKVQAKLGGPHILTGPVAVRGAKAGQVLEVRIKTIELHQDWGYNTIRPLAGALPDDFKTMRHDPHPARQAADDRQAAVGPRSRTEAVLRHHGGGAAGRLGHDQLAAAAAERRQHRQQGTGRRHDALSADPHRRRAVLVRRRPRRAGRRRGLHHRDRDRARSAPSN